MILEDSSCLMLVPKMTTKKANKIASTLMQYEESHKTIVYLTELGFTMKDALLVYNTYKSNTINKIEHNIYSLIEEIEELSFVKIDGIAKKLDIDPYDERRIKACILYVMGLVLFQNGDTYLLIEDIYEALRKYLNADINQSTFLSYIKELEDDEKIYHDQKYYYVMDMWNSEQNVISQIRILQNIPKTEYKQLDKKIREMENKNAIQYNEKQKEAIKKALQNSMTIITGGPGTGKTTIIRAIVELYGILHAMNYDTLVENVALLAPTGRAAKRMSESTLLPATTIHRFLKWNQELNQFAVNEYNKNLSKLIIIDEVSMIDLSLFDSLLKGLTNSIKLVLVGDYNQLPSVGCGQILKDLIESDVIDIVHLDLLYRQDENSYINTLAQEIKDNCLGEHFLDTRCDYRFLECSSNSIPKNLCSLCDKIVSKGYDYKRVQVMAPMYAGYNGIDNLNKQLQSVFNPPSSSKVELNYGDVIFREQDKILQLVNMPDENIFNGDIGTIQRIVLKDISNSGKNEIYVDYDGNVIKYLPKDFIKIKHGFIISIHKSQGSEFEMVIIPISSTYHRMLYRKLIYTGITRAKKKLILIGEADSFVYSVGKNDEYIRKTRLKEKLSQLCIK